MASPLNRLSLNLRQKIFLNIAHGAESHSFHFSYFKYIFILPVRENCFTDYYNLNVLIYNFPKKLFSHFVKGFAITRKLISDCNDPLRSNF